MHCTSFPVRVIPTSTCGGVPIIFLLTSSQKMPIFFYHRHAIGTPYRRWGCSWVVCLRRLLDCASQAIRQPFLFSLCLLCRSPTKKPAYTRPISPAHAGHRFHWPLELPFPQAVTPKRSPHVRKPSIHYAPPCEPKRHKIHKMPNPKCSEEI